MPNIRDCLSDIQHGHQGNTFAMISFLSSKPRYLHPTFVAQSEEIAFFLTEFDLSSDRFGAAESSRMAFSVRLRRTTQ